MIKVFKYIEKTYKLDGVCILGDYIDMYGLSFYEKDPSFGDIAELYDREIDAGNYRLDELDHLFPNAKKWYIEGNHEFRFKKYMQKFAGALRNRLSVVSELKLNERSKWSWIPYNHLNRYRYLMLPFMQDMSLMDQHSQRHRLKKQVTPLYMVILIK